MDTISWQIINTYFNDNPNNLIKHHLDSYNDFFSGGGINRVFKENNPIRFIEREELQDEPRKKMNKSVNETLLYLGGKDGSKIYFGKPILYDDNSKNVHYMYPNDARLRNMWYGITIHYDVDVDIIYYLDEEKKEETFTINKIYLGKFPIMIQSKLCILNTLTPEVRFNMGECRNDYGGYFIIAGKEKVIVSQEEFANNMLYIRKHNKDDVYSHSASIRSVSEDTSKPIRTTYVNLVRPSTTLTNNQIVVDIPNVRKEIPLFILMRALGVISDKDIIKKCLLNLEQNSDYIDLFIPSIHDANQIFTQETALKFIATFTKRKTISSVIEILTNYLLPHVGDLNFLEKAYFIGYMVNRMLRVFTKEEKPTDRDNFRYKRVKLSGTLIYELFREYYMVQLRTISLTLDKEYYFHRGKYKGEEFVNLIKLNYKDFFKQKVVESGFLKAFKGNWGATTHTKRIGVVQDLNRLSWNTFISQLRKINLPLDASAKVIGPRLLNSSQWGYIDPLDTPDGANIGLHKHMSISTLITSGSSGYPIIKWLRINANMKLLLEYPSEYLSNNTKVFVNGNWVGIIENPIELVDRLKLLRRNGVISIFISISFNSQHNELNIYSDDGRLTRPIYYIDKGQPSFTRDPKIMSIINGSISWNQIISGFKEKKDEFFNVNNNKIYELDELYDNATTENLYKYRALVDYIDTSEEENSLIAMNEEDLKLNKYYTNVEINPSLILGVMGNLIIYPENNPIARNAFSCGQSKQAVSLYHSNYQMRIDKMGVVLNYGQTPLIKSRYLEYVNKEQQPYGINAIVAIISYTGYNVEDAILINEGSVKRGIFRTTYYSAYESHEETTENKSSVSNSRFANIQQHNVVGIKHGYDYSLLDDSGMIKENTPLNDKIVIIGKMTSNVENNDEYIDSSVTLKKGQLGFVDKTFITEGETGTKLAKVRIREERIPAIGDKMACALPTQQVLTHIGWVEIKNIDINIHKVATLDTNGNMCYENPINKFEYDHNGEMYCVKNKQVEIICTLNHKLYIKKRHAKNCDKKYELLEASNVKGKMVRFQKSMKNVYNDIDFMFLGDKHYKMDDWIQLLGMFISCGSINNRSIILTASKQATINFNIDILTKLNIQYYYDNYNGYFAINSVKNNEIYIELKKYCIEKLNKCLPEYVWLLSQRQCIILLDALMQGNGNIYSDGFQIYKTFSSKLANDITRLAVHCSWSGITKIDTAPEELPNIITEKVGYKLDNSQISNNKNTYYKTSIIRKQNQPYINKKINGSNDETLIDYNGKVYCIEMPSSNLYYMRENKFAPSLLIGNSRAGQKGTLGLIIPEENMPFTSDGIRPDLIINPHAIPSRMTIGQLLESLLGKACVSYGAYGDCTAFAIKGSDTKLYGKMLTNAGFHSSGNQLLYNGMTGEQLQSDIFIGPTYYMRLKHMVKDKINYRARGPNTSLTRQPVQGRANDGGLRVGEMERDGILAHGASYFLNESFLVRGDEYFMAVCDKTGTIAIYNESKNLFLSPFVDGPIQFNINPDGTQNIKSISRFGRSFSIVKIPYTLKLLIQELQIMNIQMRIITDKNVDQLISMSYSDNYKLLLKTDETDNLKIISNYTSNINSKINNKMFQMPVEVPVQEPQNVTQVENINLISEPIIQPIPINEPQVAGSELKIDTPETIEVDVEYLDEPKNPDFESNELNIFFDGLSTKAKEMILEVKNKMDQKILLNKLLNIQKVKNDSVIVNDTENDMDILNVTEELPNNNIDLTNDENTNTETKQINLK